MTGSVEEELLNKGRLSTFVNGLAVYPPKMDKDGFDLLDIVVIKPNSSPSRMLEATHVNLANLDDVEAKRLLCGSDSSQDSLGSPPLSSTDFRHENMFQKYRQDVRLGIKGETDETVRNTAAVADILSANLRKLLLETRFRYHYLDDAKRVLIGVIVKAKYGSLRLQRAYKKHSNNPAAPDEKSSFFEGPGDSIGSGIVGVHLLVFKVSMKSGRGVPVISRSGDVSYSETALESLEMEPGLMVRSETELREGRKWVGAARPNFRNLFGLA